MASKKQSNKVNPFKTMAEEEESNASELDVYYDRSGLVQPSALYSEEREDEFEKYDLLRHLETPPPPAKDQRLTFISSNKLKIAEVQAILNDDSDDCHFPMQLICEDADLLEPQATPIEISRAKCLQARRLVDGPVVVEDTSLHFNALQGLPGPYIKHFYESLGNLGLAKLLASETDRSAYAQCVVSFSYGVNKEILTFCGIAEGQISTVDSLLDGNANKGFGWDPLFIPDGANGLSFGEMDFNQKNALSHRFKAFRQLKNYINTRSDRFMG